MMPEHDPHPSTCAQCGATVYLTKIGKGTYRWCTNPEKPLSWHCGTDPNHPVLAHAGYVGWVSTVAREA